MQQKGNITKLSLWFLPTWNESFVYLFLVIVTFVVSNINSVEQSLDIQKSTLTIQNIILSPVDWVFHHVGGETFATIVPQVMFWGFVGFLVYGLVILGRNFTNEVFNDVNESNFVRPANIGRWSAAQESLEKFALRLVVAVLGVAYTISFFRWILPGCIEQFKVTLHSKSASQIGYGILICIVFGLSIHGFTILARFIKLRPASSL